MPGCAAIGCNNRSEKGYSMKCFPRDPSLRQTWREKVGRANWEPSKNSFLCHDHFASDQWIETDNGKVKLKRDAVPSIFRETSTRKSPRKRRLDNGTQNTNTSNSIDDPVNVTIINIPNGDCGDENKYTLEYLDDGEYQIAFASTGITPVNGVEKFVATSGNVRPDTKRNYQMAYRIVSGKDIRGLEKENIIIVSDENDREIGKLIHNNESLIIVADENNKEIGQIVVDENSIGRFTSGADVNNRVDKYGDIEQRLKDICEGKDVDLDITDRKNTAEFSFGEKEDTDCSVELINRRDEDENAEGPENRDTDSLQKHGASNESRNLKHSSLARILRTGEPSDLPKITSPLKRQKRYGEDVMRSIESAFAELSERTVRSVRNDQLTQSIMRIARTRRKRYRERRGGGVNRAVAYKISTSETIDDTFESDECDSLSKKPKFTIKVMEVADDVGKIIEGVKTERNEGENKPENHVAWKETGDKDPIRIDDVFNIDRYKAVDKLEADEQFTSDFDGLDFAEDCTAEKNKHEDCGERDKTLLKRNKEFKHTEELRRKKLIVEKNNERAVWNNPNSEDDNNRLARLKHFRKSQDHTRELRQKINAQQEVIEKLTNQLIIYKGLEAKLASLNSQFQIQVGENQSLKEKLSKTAQIPVQDNAIDSKKEMDAVQVKMITDLSNKVNRLKETNKKLIQQMSTESQNKKSAYSMKQKDEQIKELNWKLEKASKFLERAEKNANTYRRKMVSMQTAIRRQKASDERRNHFRELLIDNAKHEFSEAALITAMDIKNNCGIKCYQKLLSYNFPLPSLRTLRRRFQKDNVTEDDWGDEDKDFVVNSVNQNDQTSTEIRHSNELVETEVTGTVQDIFEENNDADELNTNELEEQMFLQLEDDGRYTET